MPEIDRHLIYLDCWSAAPCTWEASLAPESWELDAARSLEQAYELLEKARCRVGVIPIVPGCEEPIAEALEQLSSRNHFAEWVALVPRDAIDQAGGKIARLVTEHCFDYHTLPVDPRRLLVTLGRAYGMSEARERAAGEADTTKAEYEMVGVSPAMRQLFRDIRKVAAVDASVFVTGETGTGKELTARAVHERSRRARSPFVAVECTALPPTLIQSELFGHERGAYTGAVRSKTGMIEAASGGTLFLDEVGDLPMDLQGNLLRFLQESTIQPVGSTEVKPVDVRVIAATHVDLPKAVSEGRFREDLYFRLQVLCLRIPPLRERGEDIAVLARFFFNHFAGEGSWRLRGFSKQAQRALRAHDWPGNVRELINRVRRAVVMCDGQLITPQDLGLEACRTGTSTADRTLGAIRADAERDALRRTLSSCGNNLSAAARMLGVSRVTIYQLLRKHELNIERPSSSSLKSERFSRVQPYR